MCSLVLPVFVWRDLAHANCLQRFAEISGSFVAAVFELPVLPLEV